MATALARTSPNLVDYLKSLDPDGAPAKIVEYLTKRSPLLEDMPMKEGNLPTGERITGRTVLPSVGDGLAWTRLNQGVASGKSGRRQVDEPCGIINGYSTLDKRIVQLNGGAAFRASEDNAFAVGMRNEVEAGTFTHNTAANPERFNGFFPRLDSTSSGEAKSQVVLHTAGASGNDQTSILFVVWGFDTCYGFFPKGSVGGLTSTDMGLEMVNDADGNPYPAWRTWWEWQIGLAVRDWRYVARVANIDTSALDTTADTLIPKMIDAYYRLQDVVSGDLRIYCNRWTAAALHQQARASVKNSSLSLMEVAGRQIVTFLGHPIRETDGILITEAPIS